MRFLAWLRVHWIWLRTALAVCSIGLIVTPTLIARIDGVFYSPQMAPWAVSYVRVGEAIGGAIAVWSILTGLIVALTGYAITEAQSAVYTLSLPIDRRTSLLHRAGSGLLWLFVPALGVFVGAHVALLGVVLPDHIEAYPFALTLRAFLLMSYTFAITFALRYAAGRRAPQVFLLALFLFGAIGFFSATPTDAGAAVQRALAWLVEPAGPLGIVTSRWTLIDV
ncbi:MAG: hypothetical protein K2X99_11790 [Gemmatimonadaceae bacterium]|nr:hypothetical protein [Gemmatimonadaceae bacterium]